MQVKSGHLPKDGGTHSILTSHRENTLPWKLLPGDSVLVETIVRFMDGQLTNHRQLEIALYAAVGMLRKAEEEEEVDNG
jgi:hypothetical protein